MTIILKNKPNFKITGLLLISVIFATLCSCTGNNTSAQVEVKNVHVANAALSSISSNVEYGSKLKPESEITVSAQTPGKVDSINAYVGQVVSKGDILFTIDKKEAVAQYQQSTAGLSNAKANLKKVQDSSITQQIIDAESAVTQAKLKYNDTKDTLDKIQTRYNNVEVSKKELDTAKLAYDISKTELDRATENLKLIKEKAGPQSVEIASAQVKQATASVNLSKIQLDNTIVTCPISGIVSVKNVNVGELISSGYPAFVVIDDKTVIAEISLPDKTVGKIITGQKVNVSVNSIPDKLFEGIIDSIAPSIDAKTQSYIVKVKINNTDKSLKPGMFSKVIIPVEKRDNVLTVPNSAIIIEDGVQYVYIANNNTVSKNVVKVGLINESSTEILEGIKLGDVVILEGQNFLQEGEKVKAVY